MLTADTILQIILRSLELSIKLYDGMSDEQKKAFADRHERRMDFWQNLFNRFDKDPKPNPT